MDNYTNRKEYIEKLLAYKDKDLIKVVSGLRRSGKSTLFELYRNELIHLGIDASQIVFLNFEDFELHNYLNDLGALYEFITSQLDLSKPCYVFLDEIQNVKEFERLVDGLFVKPTIDVYITGSNAFLLSSELATLLTGRAYEINVLPFSFTEYLEFLALENTSESIASYMNDGGFPEYLKTMDTEQLYALFNDILYRDIVTRNGIKDSKSLYRLALYLFSNIGNRITASKLKQPLSIGATSTVMSWFSFLEMSYLVSFVPMYSTSTKAQLVNPRKVYSIDLGMVKSVSTNLTEDLGRKLENMVFLFLRAKYKEIYYFDMQGECDFVCLKNNKIAECIQVCYDLSPDNLTRELLGLSKALSNFGLTKGTIVTFNQSDYFENNGMQITVIAANQFLTN